VHYTASEWWQAMARWTPKHASRQRRIQDIAQSAADSGGFVLLALSKPYFAALETDIAAAAEIAKDRIGVVSAGVASERLEHNAWSAALASTLLPAEAKLKGVEGMRGAMQGVNARIAARAASERTEWFPSTRALSQLIESWLAGAPDLPLYDRTKLSDDEVRAFVREHCLAKSASRSKLLRALRDSGRACEQSRFASLYNEVISAVGAETSRHAPGIGS
jgi:hypothetical protein